MCIRDSSHPAENPRSETGTRVKPGRPLSSWQGHHRRGCHPGAGRRVRQERYRRYCRFMTTARTVIHSARLVSGGATTPDAWVAFDSDSVLAVGTGTGWQSLGVDADRVTDAAGRWLTPGFIDIHCHGGGGATFDDGVEGIRTALDLHHHHGTTRIVLSLITASQADLEARLAVVADATEQNLLSFGAHLEGPFLDETFRGAHDPALLRAPDTDSIARLLAAGRGHLRQVTLAPE